MDGYVYTVNNKKGKTVDFWIMDKPTPKEASVIMSCRFSRYIKPTRERFEALINDAFNRELKSQMPSEQVAWEQGYEAGLAQGKHDRPKVEWIRVEPTEEDIEQNLVPLERIECSNCHLPNRHIQYDEYHDEMTVTYHNTHYCPNCGAEMSISKGKDV